MHQSVLSEAPRELPFSGRWFVMHGGDTLNVNQHMRDRSQPVPLIV